VCFLWCGYAKLPYGVGMRKPSVGFEWSYRDLLFTLLIAFMAMSILALIAVKKEETANSINQGNIMVELMWEKNVDADIDLWVQAPNEASVGYANKSGPTFNLLRDDLGKSFDSESRNQEIAVARGLKSGPYVVNVYYFNSPMMNRSVECIITVTIFKNNTLRVLTREKVVLHSIRDEATVIRFSLDGEGNLVPNSFNKVFKSISGIVRAQ